jgi:hypothetical protein
MDNIDNHFTDDYIDFIYEAPRIKPKKKRFRKNNDQKNRFAFEHVSLNDVFKLNLEETIPCGPSGRIPSKKIRHSGKYSQDFIMNYEAYWKSFRNELINIPENIGKWINVSDPEQYTLTRCKPTLQSEDDYITQIGFEIRGVYQLIHLQNASYFQ